MASSVVNLILRGKDEASGVLKTVGGSVDGLGKTLGGFAAGGAVLAAGAIAGVGVAAFNMSKDVDAATGMISTQLGVATGEAEAFADTAVNVFGNNFADSMADAAAGVVTVEQQMNRMGNMSQAAIQNVTEDAFGLRDAFEVDIAESTNAAGTLMEQFGMSGIEAMDFITAGMQGGLNASGDFLDSIGEYSNQYADAGFDAGQFFSIMDTGLQGGMLGTDKVNDSIKEMGLRLAAGGSAVGSAFDSAGLDYNAMLSTVKSGDSTWADHFDSIVGGLADIEDPIERLEAQTAIFGTAGEDLGVSFTDGLSSAGTAVEDLAGSAESLNNQYNNLDDLWGGLKRTGAVALLPFGDMALTVANEYMPKVQEGVQTLSDGFGFFMDGLAGGEGVVDSFFGAMEGFGLEGDVLVPMREMVVTIGDFATKAWEAVDPIKEFLADNVQLSDVLIGVGAVIAAVAIPALVGIIAAAAPLVLTFAAIVGAVALLRTAWETDFGGIRDFAAGIWTGIQQGFDAFKLLFEGDWDGFVAGISVAWETVWTSVVTFLGNLWVMAEPYLAEWYLAFTTWFAETDWGALAMTAITFIVDSLSQFWAFAQPIVSEWFTSFVTWYGEQDWAALGFTAMNGIINKLKDFWVFAGPTITGWYDGFVTWASTADWGAIATDIVKKIAAGLFGAQALIINALSGIVAGAWAAVVESFGGGNASAGTNPGGGGFASGGYTGDGAASQVAGFVHRGEYVFNQDAVNRIGLPTLEALHIGQQLPANTTASGTTSPSSPQPIYQFGDVHISDPATGQAFMDFLRGIQGRDAIEAFA